MEKNSPFNKWCRHNCISKCKIINLDPKCSKWLKWIKCINIRAKTRELLEENKGVNLLTLDKAIVSLKRCPKHKQ
jgi:hypothetical protein